MKYLKITIIMFALCLFLSYAPTEAQEILGISNIEVKAYKGETSLGKYKTKTSISKQTYENVGTVKLYGSGGYTDININICNKGGRCTGYYTFTTDQKRTYEGNNFTAVGDYTLKFKNPSFTIYKLSHCGIWTY